MLIYYVVVNRRKLVEVKIDLLSNPFVESWKKCLIKSHRVAPKLSWEITSLGQDQVDEIPYHLEDFIKENLENLLISFEYLHKRNIEDYSREIQRLKFLIHDDWTELDQDDLNIWHRHFTGLATKFQDKQHRKPVMWNRIHDINRHVHRCEEFTYSKLGKRKQFGPSPMYSISSYNANHEINDDLVKINKVAQAFELGEDSKIFDCFTESSDYTVWLHEDILGKDQMKTWLDDDDLTQYDCTGNLMMTINVTIDPNKFYHRVLTNPDFRDASRRSGKFVNRPPLGNVVDIENIDFQEIYSSGEVIAIELDEQPLWGDMNKVERMKDERQHKKIVKNHVKKRSTDNNGPLL